MKNITDMTTCIVYGSYGQMLVDRSTGLVLKHVPDLIESDHPEGEYHDIVRIDARAGRLDLGHHDIIRVGYWTNTGQYEPPCDPVPEF